MSDKEDRSKCRLLSIALKKSSSKMGGANVGNVGTNRRGPEKTSGEKRIVKGLSGWRVVCQTT